VTAEDRIQVGIKRKPGTEDIALPAYMSEHASGMDIRAAVEVPVAIQPGEVRLVPTGIYIAVPPGYEAQVRPRSGLASRNGITLVNTPGTIDADYRGQVQCPVINLGREPFTITRGMRIAQMVICAVTHPEVVEVDELDETGRNMGGFGSTGLH
jgi:dUTP pyrophosphatase